MINMQPEKAKKTQRRRNWLVFLIAWLAGHTTAWLILYPIAEINFIEQNTLLLYGIAGLILGSITSTVQYFLVRWQFGRNIKSWIPVSVLMWFLNTLILFQYIAETNVLSGIDEPFNTMLLALSLYATPALAQVWLLRKHVQQAWLWGLANIAGTALFAMGVNQFSSDWGVALSYGLFSSATALTLLWIFAMSQPSVKAKSILASENRLSEQEQESIRVNHGDDQDAKTRYL